MDTGFTQSEFTLILTMVAVVVAFLVGIGTIVFALFAILRQDSATRQELREFRVEIRNEIRELRDSLSQRISDAEAEQSYLRGYNEASTRLAGQQSHTHEVSAD